MSVIYDQLRVSDDGQTLFINAHVNNASYFDQLYISKITICTEDQVHEATVSYGKAFIYQEEYSSESHLRELNLVLNRYSFNEKFGKANLSQNMFFVFIECAGTPDPCTPCRLDEMTTLGVTFDYGAIFNAAMNYTRELADDCAVPGQFIDFILNYEALQLAIETEHYIPAIGYWKALTGDGATYRATKSCGCHG